MICYVSPHLLHFQKNWNKGLLNIQNRGLFSGFPLPNADWILEATLYAFNQYTLHKKWNFPLSTYTVNATKSVVSCGFSHICLKSYWWKTYQIYFASLSTCPKSQIIKEETYTFPLVSFPSWLSISTLNIRFYLKYLHRQSTHLSHSNILRIWRQSI